VVGTSTEELRRSACAGFTSIAPDAGRTLAESLSAWRSAPETVVLALPRGGVPGRLRGSRPHSRCHSTCWWCASSACRPSPNLQWAPLASGGAIVLNRDVLRYLHGGDDALESVRARETAELMRRERQYRGDQPPLEMSGRTAIVVDDGLATGATMEAAVRSLTALGAKRDHRRGAGGLGRGAQRVAAVADEVVCPYTPGVFQRRRAMVPGLRPDLGRRGARSAGTRACYARISSRTRRR